MRDCIIYVSSVSGLLDHLRENLPSMISTETGKEVVVGLSRTPSVSVDDEAMVYARLREDDYSLWDEMPFTEVWGATEYIGEGTATQVYESALSSDANLETYSRVYPHDTYTTVIDGEDVEVTPSLWFGIVSGA